MNDHGQDRLQLVVRIRALQWDIDDLVNQVAHDAGAGRATPWQWQQAATALTRLRDLCLRQIALDVSHTDPSGEVVSPPGESVAPPSTPRELPPPT